MKYKRISKSQMSTKFMRTVDQVTDSTLIEPNWEGIIACTDVIRSGEVNTKAALEAIRKRLFHENPHVVAHALQLLDACVKNCGHKVHSEIATRDFMEDFKNLVTENKYDSVKNKALEMLQCWANAFANKPEYKMVVDTHNLMKLAGFDFPSMKEADAMFMSQVAPEWADGPECYRCRSEFSLFNRKHHCRCCGQIYCDKCSSREMQLPQFGIEKEVRVCETCYEKKVNEVKERRGAIVAQRKKMIAEDSTKDKEEKEKMLREKEEEELALAIAISQSEAEAKEREKFAGHIYNAYVPPVETESVSGYKGAASYTSDAPPDRTSDDDPLARYLNRDYWDARKEGKVDDWQSSMPTGIGATAPPPSEPSVAPSICSTMMAVDDVSLNAEIAALTIGATNGALSVGEEAKIQADDTMKWCQSIREQTSVMDNRIRSNLARGRPIFNDSAIQDLFSKLTELHSHVLSRMHTLDEQRAYFESLQDHLSNIGEARQAIDELREEHERQKQERLAEEQRLRQVQMQQTLETMRMKKHAMIMEQREQALQRFQQQQQEMAMRRPPYYQPVAGYPQQGGPPPQQQQPPQQQYYGYQQPHNGAGPQPPVSSAVYQQNPNLPPQYYPPSDPSQMYYQQHNSTPTPAPTPSNGHPNGQQHQQYQAPPSQPPQHQQYYQQQQTYYQQPQHPQQYAQGYGQQQQHAQQGYQNGHQQQYAQQSQEVPINQQSNGTINQQSNGQHYGNVESAQSHPQSEQPLISFD